MESSLFCLGIFCCVPGRVMGVVLGWMFASSGGLGGILIWFIWDAEGFPVRIRLGLQGAPGGVCGGHGGFMKKSFELFGGYGGHSGDFLGKLFAGSGMVQRWSGRVLAAAEGVVGWSWGGT